VGPDAALKDEPLAVDVDAVAPRADVGVDADGLDPFNFPLSAE